MQWLSVYSATVVCVQCSGCLCAVQWLSVYITTAVSTSPLKLLVVLISSSSLCAFYVCTSTFARVRRFPKMTDLQPARSCAVIRDELISELSLTGGWSADLYRTSSLFWFSQTRQADYCTVNQCTVLCSTVLYTVPFTLLYTVHYSTVYITVQYVTDTIHCRIV